MKHISYLNAVMILVQFDLCEGRKQCKVFSFFIFCGMRVNQLSKNCEIEEDVERPNNVKQKEGS